MIRFCLLSLLLTFLALMPGCKTPPPAAAPALAPPDLSSAFEPIQARVERLLPAMAADKIEDRQPAQLALEEWCFAVGDPQHEDERRLLCQAMAARLGADTPYPARLWLLRQLERIGGDEAVAGIAALLDEPDRELRDAARRALLNNPAPRAGAALAAALARSTEPAWSAALIDALGARRDPAHVATVRKHLTAEQESVQHAAILALGRIGGRAAERDLSNAWRRARDPQRREAAGVALVHAAELALAAGENDAAVRIADLLLKPDAPPGVYRGALHVYAAARGAGALPKLLALLDDGRAEPDLRAFAAGLAADIPGASVTPTLARRVAKADSATQVLLLEALRRRADPVARPAVESVLESADPDVRAAAVEALGVVGDRGSAVLLVEAAARTDGPERELARRSLARLRGDDIDAVLLATLPNAAPAVRVEVIRALAARFSTRSTPVLVLQAHAPELDVRLAALDALGQLAAPSFAGDLIDLLLAARDEAERAAALDALVAACNREPDAERRAAPVLAEAERGPAPHPALLTALGRLGGMAALERLRASTRAEDDALRDAAVRALANWQAPDALPDLEEIARTAESKTHRVLALRGFVRLLGVPSERPPAETVAGYRRALELAERPEERRDVLAGLAKVNDPAALALAQNEARQPEFRAEAQTAVVAIAQLIAPDHGTAARDALRAVVQDFADDATRAAADKALQHLRESAGCLTHWQFAGPYKAAGADWEALYDRAFPPEQHDSAVEWKPLATTDAQHPWVYDLTSVERTENACLYVRTAVWSETEQPVQLQFGSDDAVKVWLNGNVVHEFRNIRGHQPLHDQIPATLRAGWNVLVLKVVQSTGGWQFSAAVRAPDGEPLEGLRDQAAPPAP